MSVNDDPSMRSLSDAEIALKVAKRLEIWKNHKSHLIQYNTESKSDVINVGWNDYMEGLHFPVPYQYAIDYVEKMIRDIENQLIELGFKLPS